MGSFVLRAIEILFVIHAREATVAGVVRDEETSAPLVGAVVQVTDLDRTAATDADGHYVLRGIPAGPHSLTIRFLPTVTPLIRTSAFDVSCVASLKSA